jgi:hypothetical protein
MTKNNTAICIATGLSLTREDVEFCKGRGKIYAVKEAVLYCPFADVLYAADTDWWDYKDRWQDFNGKKWTLSSEAALKYGLNHIEYDPNLIWSDKQGIIASGGNSGFQAINLAYLHGATRIILLGYDMGYKEKKHFFDDIKPRHSRDSDYKKWLAHFDKAAQMIPIEIINCTRGGALNFFPRKTLEEAFE